MPAAARHALACLVCLACLLAAAALRPAAAVTRALSATKSAALAVDADGDRQAEPGDILRYTIVLANAGQSAQEGVTLTDVLDPNTFLRPETLSTTPLAFDQEMAADGQPLAITLRGRDFDGDALSYSVLEPPAHGALGPLAGVTLTYSPTAGLAADAFTFQVRDADGNTDVGTVRIVVGAAPQIQGAAGIAPAAAATAPPWSSGAALAGDKGDSGPPRPTAGPPPPASIALDIGTLPAGKRVTLSFEAVISAGLPLGVSRIVNQARVDSAAVTGLLSDDPAQPGAADPTVTTLIRRVYFPLVRGLDADLPDLVVERLEVGRSGARVVVRNRGPVPVREPFWVDVYIGPRRAPATVNEPWEELGGEGLVWRVAGPALPLEPGAALALVIGDLRYNTARSSFSGTIQSGTQVYAQVDSVDRRTSYGAVLEGHEAFELPYNNIAGPVPAP
ncbi:MAG TPA: hypothetical protein VNL77_23670 [Roseiflexaceae bacterium]|nr:hypothetical protein [Roseiflexaceae bacterium]